LVAFYANDFAFSLLIRKIPIEWKFPNFFLELEIAVIYHECGIWTKIVKLDEIENVEMKTH
jgi:hypothetical protein